jgi:glucokinase
VDGGGQGRHGWVVLAYFFIAALLGLFVTTIAAIFLLNALVLGGSGGGEVAGGAVLSGLVGLVVLYTHLTQGLKLSREQLSSEHVPAAAASEPTPPPPPPSNRAPSWPGAVYFRLGALVGLITAVAGGVGMCNAIARQIFGNAGVSANFSDFSPVVDNKEAILASVLTTLVGLLVMWWHLAAARKGDL